ncbi:RidA family protein [Roseateles amylovorans]|uniref:RidA family protein n=1 Tax=Roseateles amylovorans TaxID=2978473 RepID=A0ABY6AXC3_9BURK|nr:RidA family protein [Roseateles amylovorans]UXH77250.1 RidA family protein [Roseateles amylovorans]
MPISADPPTFASSTFNSAPSEGHGIAMRSPASGLPMERLAALGLQLPPPALPVGAYEPWQRVGTLITTSFQLPWQGDRLAFTGRLGETLSIMQGREAAVFCALQGMAQLASAADGDLNRIRLIRVDGHVGCVPGFRHIPQVLDAASTLLRDVFEPRGRHARTALGHQVMPLDAPVMLGFLAELVSG